MAASIEVGGVCLWQAAHAPAETEWPSNLQGGPKSGTTDSRPQFCQILTDFKNFFAGRFLGKFVVKWIYKNPTEPCTCCYTTL